MSKIKLVCVDCKKVDLGDGIWLEADNPEELELSNALCPDCCHSRFPAFYSDYEEPVKRMFGVTNMLSAIKKFYKA